MAYYRGDYYRHPVPKGDYYRGHGRGDPFWGAILRGIGSVVGGALGIPKVVPAAAPAPAPGGGVTPPFALAPITSAEKQIMGTVPDVGVYPTLSGSKALPPGAPGMIPSRRVAAGPPLPAKFLAGARKRRRMNPGNIKALRRSIRRVCSFGKVVNSMKGQIRKAANEVAPVHHTRRALPAARR